MSDEVKPTAAVHAYGRGTRLSNAYTVGRDGLPCPKWIGDKSSAAYLAWLQGHDEFMATLKRPYRSESEI